MTTDSDPSPKDGQSLDRTISDGVVPGVDRFAPTQPRLPLSTADGGLRFAVIEELGRGANGRVYRVLDRELERDVAVKVISPGASAHDIESMLREARIAARLEHPNIVPVYDIAVTDAGHLWFAMKRIDGMSLAAAIDAAIEGQTPAPIATVHSRVEVVLQACNAVSAAHTHGLIHRDIKPANIMLGRFGEVLLVDWGTASEGTSGGRVGTPLYMSPEQARGEEATAASDVYSIGATLLHLLTLRMPLGATDEKVFWTRKCAGDWDQPSAEERRRIPRHLLAIVRKAMAPSASGRYATATELAAELRRWQSGQAISACRDTVGEALVRFHRRHGRSLWITLAILAVIGLLAGLVVGERLKRLATWGAPIMVERFADGDGWKRRWQILDGSYAVRDGRLVTTGKASHWLLWPQRLSGATAIEYEAVSLPDSHPCDLSLIWCRELDPAITGREHMRDAILLQFGAIDGAYTAITGTDQRHLAINPRRPEAGRVHHVRCEIIDDTMTMRVDGELLVRYRDRLPLVGGYFALYGFYPGKAFGPVRVYSLGTPEVVPATAVGDAFAERGDNLAAAEAYRRVATAHPEREISREATYRRGLCLFRAEAFTEAFSVWEPLGGTRYQADVELHRCQRQLAAGDRAGALAGIIRLAASPDVDQRARVLQLWGMTVRDLCRGFSGQEWRDLQTWSAARARLPADPLVDRDHAESLGALGRNRDLLRLYPDQRYLCALALIRLGRGEEVLKDFRDQRLACANALRAMGRGEEAYRLYREFGKPSDVPSALARRIQDLLAAGDLAGALAEADGGPEGQPALELAAWQATVAGRREEAGQRLAELASFSDAPALRFLHLVALPLHTGGAPALQAACTTVCAEHRWSDAQAPWHTAAYLLGRIDAATFLAQPGTPQARALLTLLDGVRAECAGRDGEAITAYRGFLAVGQGLTVERSFAQERLRLLAP